MSEGKEQKSSRREDFRRKNSWFAHRPWYIYTAAVGMKQPFYLPELQEAIRQKTGVRPQLDTILKEIHSFYELHDLPILARTEPGAEIFTVNDSIDLSRESYQVIMQRPQGLGRPRKDYTQIPEYRKKYNRNLRRLTRHPERFLNRIFGPAKETTTQDVAKRLPEFVGGVQFGLKTIQRLLDIYTADLKGPPYIRKVRPGVYRKITKQTAVKYYSQTPAP